MRNFPLSTNVSSSCKIFQSLENAEASLNETDRLWYIYAARVQSSKYDLKNAVYDEAYIDDGFHGFVDKLNHLLLGAASIKIWSERVGDIFHRQIEGKSF